MRFGDPEEVNYGRGCKVLKSEKSGNNLIVTFAGAGNGLPDDEFAAKLLGKTSDAKLLFGYARLPGVDFIHPILSARMPEIIANDKGFNLKVEVQNFGQLTSKTAQLKIVYTKDAKEIEVTAGKIPGLKPYEKTTLNLTCGKVFDAGKEYNLIVIINPNDKIPTTLHGKLTPVK